MSDITSSTLRRELLIEQGIEQQLDTLVGLATQTVLKLPAATKMEESQLRNLLNASLETPSIEVVANFVRYQIARKKEDWQANADGFGHTVINIIYNQLAVMADQVVDLAQKQARAIAEEEILEVADPAQKQTIEQRRDLDIHAFQAAKKEIHIRLMHLYLGQLNRAFYFYKKSQAWQERDRTAALQSLEKVVELFKGAQ